MCYLQGKRWVYQWTENPFIRAVKDLPIGGCFCTLWAAPQTEEFRLLLGGREARLWKLCHFHTFGAECCPCSPTKGQIHYSASYDIKRLSMSVKGYPCSLVEKVLKIRSFQILKLFAEKVLFLPAFVDLCVSETPLPTLLLWPETSF